MTATEDFFKSKIASSWGNGTVAGSATEDFFKSKIAQNTAVSQEPSSTVIPDSRPSEALAWNPMDALDPMKKFLSGIHPEQQKVDSLIESAKSWGLPFIEKLKPEEKDALIGGLKLKSLPIDQIPEPDRKLVADFDNTPKENRTSLQLSLNNDQINQIAKYRDWRVQYTPEDQKNAQILSDKKIVAPFQWISPTKLEQGTPQPSLESLKSITNIGSMWGNPANSVDWQGIGTTIKDGVFDRKKIYDQAKWDIAAHYQPIIDQWNEGANSKDASIAWSFKNGLKTGWAVMNTLFFPISYALTKVSDEQNPEANNLGNLINSAAALPANALSGVFYGIGKGTGMDDETAKDFGAFTAGMILIGIGLKKSGATTKELTTLVDRSKEQFTKIADLPIEDRIIVRKWINIVHPDKTWLNSSYFIRLKEAAAKWDMMMVNKIVEEAKIARANKKTSTPPVDETVIPVTNETKVAPLEKVSPEYQKPTEIITETPKATETAKIQEVPPIDEKWATPTKITKPEIKDIVPSDFNPNSEATKASIQKVFKWRVEENMNYSELDPVQKLLTVHDLYPGSEKIYSDLNKKYIQSLSDLSDKEMPVVRENRTTPKDQWIVSKPRKNEAFTVYTKNPGEIRLTQRDKKGNIVTDKKLAVKIPATDFQKSVELARKKVADNPGSEIELRHFDSKILYASGRDTTIAKKEDNHDIKNMSDEAIMEKYKPEEITAIENKKDPTPQEAEIKDRYIKAVEKSEMKRIQKQIEEDYQEQGIHDFIWEETDISYGDIEKLAERIATTLKNPKLQFGLKRGIRTDMSTKTERYLKTSAQSTLEALTEDFSSLRNWLKEILDYYKWAKKHPYTQELLGELHREISQWEYDSLVHSDIFQKTINPYLYEWKKQVSKNVRKTPTTRSGESGSSRNTRMKPSRQEVTETRGTSKKWIVNALKEVDKKFQSLDTRLSTKIIEALGSRETVSKEFIQNLTNSWDVKQVEKDIIRSLLEGEWEKVNVTDFKKKVQAELLPLKVATKNSRMKKDPNAEEYFGDPNKYEFVNLPTELRGDIKNYRENIYESPINTQAGNIHFEGNTEKYFGHTRIEDMADGNTRRVIEVQSDLFQKGNLEKETHRNIEFANTISGEKPWIVVDDTWKRLGQYVSKNEAEIATENFQDEYIKNRKKELKKLSQYNDPTAHFRMIREEVAQAAKDGVQKLQFPTGETAMKIEWLWENTTFRNADISKENYGKKLESSNLEIWLEIEQWAQAPYTRWIITNVLWDWKFTAIPKVRYNDLTNSILDGKINEKNIEWQNIIQIDGSNETFDISWKIEQNNPIFKFYEKEVGKYLKNNYDAKLISDDKWVSWYEINIKPDMQDKVLAFQSSQSDSWIYDLVGEKYNVKPFAKEKIAIADAYMEAVRLAPKGWQVKALDPTKENFLIRENGEEVVAYADLENKEIVISTKEARKSTAAHEVVHASISQLSEDKKKVLIATAKKQWEKQAGKLSDEQAEEFIAEEFKYYYDNKKFKTKSLYGRISDFLSTLWQKVKWVFGKENKIKSLYDDIIEGKETDIQSPWGKKYQSLSEWENLDFWYRYEKKPVEKTPSKVLASIVDFGSESFVPIDSVIGDIDAWLKQKLHKFENGVHNSPVMQEWRKILTALNEKLKPEKKSEEYRILDLALKNWDKEIVDKMAEKLGIVDELKNAHSFLDALHTDAERVGIDIGYKENYFPRTTGDAKGLIAYIHKTEIGSEIEKAIKLAEIKAGKNLTDEDKAGIANKMLRGFEIEGISLSKPWNAMERTIKEVTQELNPFYNDSISSLAIYIQSMNENIEARKLFGKVYSEEEIQGINKIKSLKLSIEKINDEMYPLMEEYDWYDREKAMEKRKELKKQSETANSLEEVQKVKEKFDTLSQDIKNYDRLQELKTRKKNKITESEQYQAFDERMVEHSKQEDIQASIGAYTLELIKEGKISPAQEVALTKALQARFATPHMSAFVSAYKGITHITTMGSFFSALSQIQDIGFSIHENGHLLTANAYGKAIFGLSQIKAKDLGIEPIIFEFSDPGIIQKMVAQVFKMVGISLLDKAGKETMINGYYKKIQRIAKDESALKTEIKKFDFTPEEQKGIIEALKKNEVNEEIKYMLFCKVMDYQPITKSQMPVNYLTSGNARILYTLKTYSLKQIDAIRQQGFHKISEGKRMKNPKMVWWGVKSLMSIAYALFTMGCVSDILKDLFGNRPINISDLVWDNILKLVGFSKYTTYKIKEESLSAGILSIIAPPFNFFNDPLVDYYYFTKESAKWWKLHPFDITKLQSINNIPVVGKPFYWWIGKWADKSEKKRNAGEKMLTPKSTKKVSPFSSSSGFKGSSSGFKSTNGFK
jgi:hypothetical protein